MSLDEIINRISEIERKWLTFSNIPEDLFGVIKGLTKIDITSILVQLRLDLELAKETGQKIDGLYLYQLSTQLTNIENHINQHLPSNPTAHMPGFVSILYSLRTIVSTIIIKIEEDGEGKKENSIAAKLKDRLTESLAKSQLANQLLANTNDLITKNREASTDILKILQSSQDATTKIQERDRTTTEATNRINETEKKSVNLVNQLDSHLKQVTKSSDEIKKQQEDLSKISKTLNDKFKEVQDLLEDTNRLGLAGAFKTRKENLTWPARGWIALFLLSIILLSLLAKDSMDKYGSDWHMLLLRLPFSAPLIWVGWFSVKQYGYTRKIQEDYSFKVASAMSLQGYKNEVNADQEMIKLLQKSAIENFSSNPLRIYDDEKNHGSPLHELLDGVKKERFDRALDLFKALKS